jgi:alpha-galactosidase
MVNAMTTHEPLLVYGNVRNGGLIENLPSQAVVEVPCHVDADGIKPCRVGRIPGALAAAMTPHILCHEMAVEAVLRQDRELVYQAVQADPMTGMALTLPEIRAMVDELFAANAAYVTDWPS